MSTVYAIPKLAPFKSPLSQDDLFYPDSDGEPMADNDQQYQTMVDVRFGLQQRYGGQDVYVGANLLIYFEEGDASKRVAPDVFVALDVPPGLRRTYLIWTEGKPPDVVFEIASRRSWKADVSWKKGLYQVWEYKNTSCSIPPAPTSNPSSRDMCSKRRATARSRQQRANAALWVSPARCWGWSYGRRRASSQVCRLCSGCGTRPQTPGCRRRQANQQHGLGRRRGLMPKRWRVPRRRAALMPPRPVCASWRPSCAGCEVTHKPLATHRPACYNKRYRT